MSPRVLIAGYFGHGLVGDEAVLDVMLAEFRERWPSVDIIATSADPVGTHDQHGVRTAPLSDLRVIGQSVDQVDLVVIGGGGVFSEYSDYRPPAGAHGIWSLNALCMELPAIAALKGKPSVIFAAGVEPLRSEAARAATANAFHFATRACIRDSSSRAVLGEILPSESVPETTCDPAAGLVAAKLDRAQILGDHGLDPKRPVVTLSLRHWDVEVGRLADTPQPWEQEVARALEDFCASEGAQLLAAPHHLSAGWAFSDDAPLYERLFAQIPFAPTAVFKGDLRPATIAAVQALGQMHLAMRHHGVVLAGATCTPCVAIAYSAKVRGAMSDLGLDARVIDLADATSDSVLALLKSGWRDRTQIREGLAARLATRRLQIRRSIDLAEEALEVGPTAVAAGPAIYAARRWFDMAVNEEADADTSTAVVVLMQEALGAGAAPAALLPLARALHARWPKNSSLAYYRGFLELTGGGDRQAAEAALTIAVQQGPLAVWALTLRAELYCGVGRAQEAHTDLDEAERREPGFQRITTIRALLNQSEADAPEMSSPSAPKANPIAPDISDRAENGHAPGPASANAHDVAPNLSPDAPPADTSTAAADPVTPSPSPIALPGRPVSGRPPPAWR
jgi:polysaccharide pyruvyl transferase WcaK-like protein